MSNKLKQFAPEFKTKVALAALKNEDTLPESAARFGVHLTMITVWKRILLDGASEIFDKNHKAQKQTRTYPSPRSWSSSMGEQGQPCHTMQPQVGQIARCPHIKKINLGKYSYFGGSNSLTRIGGSQ